MNHACSPAMWWVPVFKRSRLSWVRKKSLWSPCVENVQLRTKPVGKTMLAVEEGTERVLVSETGEECFEMMSSGHDRAIELMDSPQL